MSDAEWREAERRWRAQPTNAHLDAAIAAGRRHGARLPATMLFRQMFPARSFACDWRGGVSAQREDEVKPVGNTPAAGLKIPAHRMWWFHPLRSERVTFDLLLEHVARESIAGLILDRSWVSDADLARLAVGAPELAGLDLRGPPATISDATLVAIAALQRLQRLHLSGETHGRERSAPAASFAPIRDLPELVELRVTLPALPPDVGPDLPRRLHRLQLHGQDPYQLELAMSEVDRALPALAALEELADLDLMRTDATDAGLRPLLTAAAPRLERLRVANCRAVTGAALAGLEASRLVELELGGSTITDVALAHVARGAPGLRRLGLARCVQVGDEGVARIAELTSLEELDLDHCPGVTSAGLAKLVALVGLRKLYVRGSASTVATQGAGRDAIREALPRCKVY